MQARLRVPGSSFQEPTSPSPQRHEWGSWVVVAGIVVTLAGLIGNLVSNALHGGNSELAFGRGADPWLFVMFGGIVVAAVGAIKWTARARTDAAGMAGAVMAVLLVAAVALGGWAAWKNTDGRAVASGSTQGGAGAPVGGIHNHAGHGVVAGEGSEGASHFGHVHGKPGPVTPAERKVLDRQLAVAKRASAKYRDISVARADGYIQITQFIPGLGLHMAKLSLLRAGFDPAHPQILLYQPDGKGGDKLVGVAYSMPNTSDTPPQGFAGGSDVWHYHTDLCFLKGGAVTITQTRADCQSSGGYFQAKTPWLLHAWVWTTNPRGVFTEYNSRVT